MTFINQQDFDHKQSGKIGVLLINLGTPTAPTARAIRRFLREFLGDPRVVEIPRLIWWFILHLFILPFRPKRSARAYSKIWTEQGSPLMVHTQAQAQALQNRLGDQVILEYAMRYGGPSIESRLQALLDAGARKLLIVPLFPQYSGTTAGSIFDAVSQNLSKRRWVPDLRMVSHYHDEPGYIRALSNSVQDFQQKNGVPQKLVMSFHGLPQRCLDLGDPYYCECQKTGRLLAEDLGLREEQYLVSFQSRLGAAQWLQPYTDESLRELAGSGIEHVQTICPGFSSDCLETLEEIALQNRDTFLNAGGGEYAYIPALNSEPEHIEFLSALLEKNLQGWR